MLPAYKRRKTFSKAARPRKDVNQWIGSLSGHSGSPVTVPDALLAKRS